MSDLKSFGRHLFTEVFVGSPDGLLEGRGGVVQEGGVSHQVREDVDGCVGGGVSSDVPVKHAIEGLGRTVLWSRKGAWTKGKYGRVGEREGWEGGREGGREREREEREREERERDGGRVT